MEVKVVIDMEAIISLISQDRRIWIIAVVWTVFMFCSNRIM